MLAELLLKWPLIRQLKSGTDGTGVEAMSDVTRALRPKTEGADVARSICPYCGVGCGQLVYHLEGKVVGIEGDPESPISRGHLCPKGSASYQLVTHDGRLTKVKYRAPRSKSWSEIPLDEAMRMVAERVWETRARTFDDTFMHTTGMAHLMLADRVWESREHTFEETRDGESLMQTKAIAHLGGATLDNEENYLIKKLFTGGLGMVCVSNQARI